MDYDYFMRAALDQARQALAAGEFPVGCVVANGRGVVAVGARAGTRGAAPNETDHAEMQTLRQLSADDMPLKNRHHLALFTTMEPCLMCYGAIILSGIGTVVYAYEDVMGGATNCDLKALPPLYRRRRPKMVAHMRRRESLELFQAYFTDPANEYWRGSLLARYTLTQ